MTHSRDSGIEQQRAAAVRQLVAHTDQVGRVSGHEPWRSVVLRLTGGRWGRRHGWPVTPHLATPWQDTVSPERRGWRMRAANLPRDADDGLDRTEFAFAVDYTLCLRCRIGWVEQPHTLPAYQRHGLAKAGLAALRAEHPGLAWHTLGGHINGSGESFWGTIGADVPGGYRPRRACVHLAAGS